MRAVIKELKNKDMNQGTYNLRREVMKYIYEAKELLGGNMPRITVRVTDNDKKVLAYATFHTNTIWISEQAVTKYDLRQIVFHELVHTLTGFGHDENCPLMKSKHSPLSKELCNELFLKYVKAS